MSRPGMSRPGRILVSAAAALALAALAGCGTVVRTTSDVVTGTVGLAASAVGTTVDVVTAPLP